MTSPEAAPARVTRPRAVDVAYWLQLATVAVLLVVVALVVVQAVRYDARIDDVLRQVPDADPAEVSDERGGNIFTTVVIGLPALLLAGWLGATVVPLRRGSNVARILVFVAAGGQLLLCLGQVCTGLAIVPLLLIGGMGDPEFDPSTGELPDGGDWEQSKFLDTLYSQDGDSGAVAAAAGGIGVLLVVTFTAAVVVLLLLPEVRRWFRRDVPPVPAAGPWPGYGYGHPQPGQPVWLPPGSLLCPDPAAHAAPVLGGPRPDGHASPERPDSDAAVTDPPPDGTTSSS
ncbi:hypothetical protein [Micromonospora auratinigra]|uniref:Uncharacterized protein n=1 Tax=Micromonospora auratinigra TaxID=261654 RepID=A0A1A9A1W0_9ACTN|nr:hypothetical protein [Micromonospora auratinigra]SBT50179.1 hypothetical protein GA0070611_4681 [Micromonospora auratinigra]